MNRVGLMFTLCLAVAVAFGQSREELRRKFGGPVSETFAVRPGIGVTVTYSNTGRITEMVISPQTTYAIKSRTNLLSLEVVKTILEELVPKSDRGRFMVGTFEHITCLPDDDCQGTSEDYEKVTIYFNSATEGKVHYAVIQWKK
jgi:hypothetical protein